MYKVYIKLDDNKSITNVESTAFHTEEELVKQGYIYLDEGEDGETYGHAQPNYLKNKYNKLAYDERGCPNFKYINDKVEILTDAEKERLFKPSQSQQPSMDDRVSALESAVLAMMGGM